MKTQQTAPSQMPLGNASPLPPNDDRPPLPEGWVNVHFSDVVKIVPITDKKVKQRDYLPVGKLPVVDQGQDFIGGYTDEIDKRIACKLPVIIFGDHTKALKFVNFDFVAGADGIKVLEPSDIFYPKLLYYFLRALNLPDRGYSRHFQFLKKETIPLPPLPEQHRIVAAIETQFTRLDAAVAALHRAKATLARYKASVLKAACEGRLVPTDAALYHARCGYGGCRGEAAPDNIYKYTIRENAEAPGRADIAVGLPRPSTDACVTLRVIMYQGFTPMLYQEFTAIMYHPFTPIVYQ